jgi:DNA sulfur modification protein DndD
MNESKQSLAQRRIAATQDSIERLIEVKTRLDNQFRSSLENRVQEIFALISFTPYIPKLSEKYELTLIENTAAQETTVAASTGENQILSLSFIAGIIDRVRDWIQENALMGPDSSTFPIVMDSPFGSLDEIYRRQIAKILPQLANQLVILVTKTQWRGEVAQEMAKYLGREYVLTYNSPKPDCEEDSIELGGENYPLVKQSPNQSEYTEIVEVDYGF